jgi:hypothetical protein
MKIFSPFFTLFIAFSSICGEWTLSEVPDSVSKASIKAVNAKPILLRKFEISKLDDNDWFISVKFKDFDTMWKKDQLFTGLGLANNYRGPDLNIILAVIEKIDELDPLGAIKKEILQWLDDNKTSNTTNVAPLPSYPEPAFSSTLSHIGLAEALSYRDPQKAVKHLHAAYREAKEDKCPQGNRLYLAVVEILHFQKEAFTPAEYKALQALKNTIGREFTITLRQSDVPPWLSWE